MPDFNARAESQERQEERMRSHALHRFQKSTGKSKAVKRDQRRKRP